MQDKKIRLIVSVGILVIGFLVLLPTAGLPAAVIFAIIWFEKVTLAISQGMLAEVGVEFATVPIIFIGALYGPVAGFIVGFFGMPVMDALKWFIAPPKFTGGWPPFVPGPDTFVDGVTGAIAGVLIQFLSFSVAGPLAVIAKNIMAPVKDAAAYGQPPKPAYIINTFFNFFLVGFLSFVLHL